jgi:DNA helicase HerA-like ATPase
MPDSAPIGTHADTFFGEPNFSVPAEARRKHMALFGGTGTGKSTLLVNMAAADLEAGTGITAVDPHGGFCEDVSNNHIPRHRKNDVILFDPKSRTHAMGLNVLDCPRPEERGLVVSGIVSIFKTLWADSWGARLEDILRNSLWALIEQPTPSSLLALPKLLTDDAYRATILRHVENPVVLDFFINTYARWTSSFR